MPKKIYLDHAATTPVDPKVLKTMLPYFSKNYGNAMSVHSFGQEALKAVDAARARLALFFGCSPTEIVFTSGATESNNLSIKGVVRSYTGKFKTKPHIITTAFEHHCVLDTCKILAKDGKIDLTLLPVHRDGLVRLGDIKKAIRTETILVSVMYVNNEIGTLQPIAAIGKFIQKLRSENASIYPIFHTDATQGVPYLDCNVENLGVDLLSFSGHKIYGPKGVGALYVRKNTPIRRIQDGGDQEYKLRAGTHNVPGIVGLGKAVELLEKAQQADNTRIVKLRDYLIRRILKEIPQSYLNGSAEQRTPNNANFRFDSVEGEGLVLSLDMEGIAGSTGSACSSGALEPSHVLLALGIKPEQAHGSLRFTLGRHTTKQEVDHAISKLKQIIARLRKISGTVLKEFS